MSSDKFLALIFSLLILGQAYWVRRWVGTWLFPACLLGLFWFGFTFLPLAVLFWVPVHPYAIGFILLCTASFSLGSVPFDWKSAFAKNSQKRETVAAVYGSPFLKRAFYGFSLAGLVCVLMDSLAQGVTLHDLVFDLLVSASDYADLRTDEMLNVTLYGRCGTIFAFVAAILGGLLFAQMRTKMDRGFVVVTAFLPAIFMAVAQSSKWTLSACIVFFYAAVLVRRVWAGEFHLFRRVSIRSLALCVALLAAIAAVSFFSRGRLYEQKDDVVRDRLVLSFASYTCAHVYAFSDWFSFSFGGQSQLTYHNEGPTYGFYTFAPLFRVMGSHKIIASGTFDDYYSYGDFLAGNIFTMFRGLVLDFGFIGSLVFMLVTGVLFHLGFRAMLWNRRPVFTAAVFVFMLGYFYSSFAISMLSVSTTYLSFGLLWIVFHINARVLQRQAIRGLAVGGVARRVATLS